MLKLLLYCLVLKKEIKLFTNKERNVGSISSSNIGIPLTIFAF